MSKLRRWPVWLWLLLLLSACAAQHTVDSDGIISSPLDSREYRFLELDNGMRVVLVSDAQADKAAAALRVNVGSGDNPEHRQGLAHFLEHMLFLGTEKYPDADEYGTFINDHGGSHNAGTALDYTVYFFDIDPDYLDPGLDRFAQFFIAPLFNREYVERDMNAVDSEYSLRIKDDGRREGDVFREIVNPSHPLAMLGVGNLRTLRGGDTDIVQDLLDFYDAHYSANLMSLVVLGRQDLDSLEEMVQKFTAVPNRQRQQKEDAPPLFEAGRLPLQVNIEPVQERRELTLMFPLPASHEHWRSKPQLYIGDLLGHEGPGSLLSVLKGLGWAESVAAISGGDIYGQSMFQLQITLSEAGLENYRSVVGLAFAAIEQIRDSGIERWRFQEQGELAAQAFHFMERGKPIGTVMSLSASMQYLPVPELFRGQYSMQDYEPELFRQFLDYMQPENVQLTLMHRGVTSDRTSFWYDTPYRVESLEPDTIRGWLDPELTAALSLPRVNPFIAQRLDVAAEPPDNPQRPVVLNSVPGFRFWHRQDASFQVPRASLQVRVFSPAVGASAESAVLNQLYLNMVTDELNETTYYALLAGLQFRLRANSRGFDIAVSGYSDRQEVLLQRILDSLIAPALNSDRFNNIRAEMLRNLANADKQEPRVQLSRRVPQLLFRPRWTEQEQLEALQHVDHERLRHFVSDLFTGSRVEALSYGNVTRDEAERLAQQLRGRLLGERSGEQDLVPLQVVDLAAGQLLEQLRVDHPDSGFILYLQGIDDSRQSRANLLLANQIIGTPFYDRLRTEQQLGYVVGAYNYPLFRVPGLALLIQSPRLGPQGLYRAVEEFLTTMSDDIDQMTDAAFEKHRQAVILRLLERPRTLQEQADRFWSDLTLQHFGLDDREQLANTIRQTQLGAWQEYFRTSLAGAERQALVLVSAGADMDAAAPSGIESLTLDGFRQHMPYRQFREALSPLP